jgi:hypothetical protein
LGLDIEPSFPIHIHKANSFSPLRLQKPVLSLFKSWNLPVIVTAEFRSLNLLIEISEQGGRGRKKSGEMCSSVLAVWVDVELSVNEEAQVRVAGFCCKNCRSKQKKPEMPLRV